MKAWATLLMLVAALLATGPVAAHERPGPERGLDWSDDLLPADPVGGVDRRVPVTVRGIYLTGFSAGNEDLLRPLVGLVERTELNAVVIDIKDCTGQLMYRSQVPLAMQIGAPTSRIPDLAGLCRDLRRRGIYTIARLVVFQDPILARARPDLAVVTPSGTVWQEPSGLSWVDPHAAEVWEYVVAIATEAAGLGFDEIQYDYVRFPSDGRLDLCVYPHADGRKKHEVIGEFLVWSRERLAPQGVYLSADIYGLVPTAIDDMGIGQRFPEILAGVDYACPMAYPSHYAPHSYGIPDPDAEPYLTVSGTLQDAMRRRGDSPCIIRPWLQDFSLGHRYGAAEVRAQIQAVYDAGFSEWLLWSPSNRYSEGALLPARLPGTGD